VAISLHGVPRHVRERAGCLFLDRFNGGEFETFLVGGNFISSAHVEIVARQIHQTLLVCVSQKLAAREAESQSIASPSLAGAKNSRWLTAEPTDILRSFADTLRSRERKLSTGFQLLKMSISLNFSCVEALLNAR